MLMSLRTVLWLLFPLEITDTICHNLMSSAQAKGNKIRAANNIGHKGFNFDFNIFNKIYYYSISIDYIWLLQQVPLSQIILLYW